MRNRIDINGVTYRMVNESSNLTDDELDDIYEDIVNCGKSYTVNRDGRKVKMNIEFNAYESSAPGTDGYTLEVTVTDSEENYDVYYSGDEDLDDLLKMARKISRSSNSRNSVFDVLADLGLHDAGSGNRGTNRWMRRKYLRTRYGY